LEDDVSVVSKRIELFFGRFHRTKIPEIGAGCLSLIAVMVKNDNFSVKDSRRGGERMRGSTRGPASRHDPGSVAQGRA